MQAKIYTDNTGSLAIPMVVGETLEFGYTTVPELAEVTMPGVSWSSSDESVATVDDNGKVTAISEGTSVITIQPSTINLMANASIKVNVVQSAVQVTSIEIADDAAMTDEDYGLPSCYMGETMQLSATVHPDDATYRTVYWSSADDAIATVDHITGLVTGVSQGRVVITANALDDSKVTASHEIYIDQVVIPLGIAVSDDDIQSGKFSIDEKSHAISFVTYPEQATKSLLTWTSSDETVATVSGGVVTFKSYGSAAITVTCPDSDEDTPEGYSKSFTLSFSIPAGYYNETFSNETTEWALNNDHVNSGASMVKQYNSATGENYWLITPYLNGTTGRGDIQHSGSSTYLDPANYPILCFRIDDVNDTVNGGYSRNITLDTSGNDLSGTSYSGGINGSNNKWKTKYTCSDNSSILVYDLSSQEFATGGLLTSIGTFGTFQLKYADIKTVEDASTATYRYFWFLTFAGEDEMKAYLNAWSSRTGITYN
ncbi:MAG: Ig-like domain-containing protein [Bacteroidales bacterium]|nr:Ig-like domain-containing protein [Bacteroidales bacterium]